ncbi:hypothetical protein LzC2_23850 [Planctomycetes bacterium LzC2]|uniref:Uncharacterized protein n=1 Tax=Alienimonas chondri TaxID=2681879 RepID=A0ABX1VEI6_9PLAN|nr:hypothetical protein [Alienimonas chondri]
MPTSLGEAFADSAARTAAPQTPAAPAAPAQPSANDAFPAESLPGAVAAASSDEPAGFDPFSPPAVAGLAAPENALPADNATGGPSQPALAAPMPPAIASADPFSAEDPFSPRGVGAGSVSANVGTLPIEEADVPPANDPFGPNSVAVTGPAPELSFGRPPLPPGASRRPGDSASNQTAPVQGPADPALMALAAPDDGSAGLRTSGYGPRTPSFGGESAAGPNLAALAAPMPLEEPTRDGRFAPTAPSSAAATPPDLNASPSETASQAEDRGPLVAMRTSARPTPRPDARRIGGVELEAPRLDAPVAAQTASPAAPLAAGLGIGVFLLVGLSLWRRRGGLL